MLKVYKKKKKKKKLNQLFTHNAADGLEQSTHAHTYMKRG